MASTNGRVLQPSPNIRLATAARPGSLHEEIEPLVKSHEGGPFAFLDKVVASAENSQRHFVERDFQDATTCFRASQALHRVEYDEWIPALLAFLNNPVTGLPESEFVVLLEKVTMQNWVRPAWTHSPPDGTYTNSSAS